MYLFCISFRVRRWVEMPVTTVGRERRCSVDGARPHVRRVPRKGPLKRPCLDRKTTQQTIVFRVRRISARSTGTLFPLAAVGTFPGHDEARQAGGGEGGGRLLLPRLFRGRLALFCGRVRHRRDY